MTECPVSEAAEAQLRNLVKASPIPVDGCKYGKHVASQIGQQAS